MAFCYCHAALPLSCCLTTHVAYAAALLLWSLMLSASLILLYYCHAAVLLSCSACSCHARLLVSYCFATCYYKPYSLVIAFTMLVGSIFPPSTVAQLGHFLPGCLFFFVVNSPALPCHNSGIGEGGARGANAPSLFI